MSAQHFNRTVHSEQIRVRGGDIGELRAVLLKIASEGETGAHWFIESDTIVIAIPGSEELVGGSDYLGAAP